MELFRGWVCGLLSKGGLLGGRTTLLFGSRRLFFSSSSRLLSNSRLRRTRPHGTRLNEVWGKDPCRNMMLQVQMGEQLGDLQGQCVCPVKHASYGMKQGTGLVEAYGHLVRVPYEKRTHKLVVFPLSSALPLPIGRREYS